ncbi:MAG: menaquinol oxidoreductase, partial [Desulfarculaceae bacterium]
ILLNPKNRANEGILAACCCMVFLSTWIDKGLGMMAGGYTPNPLHEFTEYAPTGLELMISFGIWAVGLLIITVLYKVATGVKEEVEA